MASEGQLGYGSTLTLDDVDVGQLLDISGPKATAPAIKITNNDSPEARQEKFAGLIDEGQLTSSIVYFPGGTNYADLRSVFVSRRTVDAELAFPDDSGFIFACIITELGPEAPVEDKMMATFTLELTGVATYQEG